MLSGGERCSAAGAASMRLWDEDAGTLEGRFHRPCLSGRGKWGGMEF
jgi:hypothetical protein